MNRPLAEVRSLSSEQRVSLEDADCRLCFCGSTFARLVMDADGLCLVIPVIVLDAHQMRVGAVVEACTHGQHVLVGLVHGLHQLQGQRISLSD